MVGIVDNEVTRNFVLLSGMAPSPSIVPVAVAVVHGEGGASLGVLSQKDALVAVRFVDSAGQPIQVYPSNQWKSC